MMRLPNPSLTTLTTWMPSSQTPLHTRKKSSMFIAIIGARTFKVLKNLCNPDAPSTKAYADLKKLLSDHYAPAPITIAEPYKFWTAHQNESESVA